MERDIDLIRKILEAVVKIDPGIYNDTGIEIEGYSFDAVAFHLELLEESGYVKANVIRDGMGRFAAAWPRSLTWQGYEFLELARNNSAWEKSKSVVKQKSMSISFAVFVELLKAAVKEAVGLN